MSFRYSVDESVESFRVVGEGLYLVEKDCTKRKRYSAAGRRLLYSEVNSTKPEDFVASTPSVRLTLISNRLSSVDHSVLSVISFAW